MSPLRADRIVVPIASEDDGIATAKALGEQLIRSGSPRLEVVLVHVIEKGGGTIDKAPMDARREQAERSFEAARSALADANAEVIDSVVYETDLIDGIVTAAEEQQADAIVLRPRESGRLMRLLTGDRTAKLVHRSAIPVLVLSTSEED